MRMLITRRFCSGILVLVAALLTGGCFGGRAHFSTFAPSFEPRPEMLATVGQVIDGRPEDMRGDVPSDFDPTAELREQLQAQLAERGLSARSDAPTVLILTPTITDYQPGNAFLRWIAPGAGATVLRVSCKVEQDGIEVGTIRVRRAVECCGGYSIGQWKFVFADVAADVIDELKKKIRPGK
jgi:hypothetical protein